MTRVGGGLAEQKNGNGLVVPDSSVIPIDRGVRKRGPSSDGDEPDRPVIKIEAGQLPRMVDEGSAALSLHPNLYQRSGELVTIVREPDRVDPDWDVRKGRDILLRPGTPRLRRMSAPSLRCKLADVASWLKFIASKGKDNDGEGKWVPSHPDPAAVAAIIDPTAAGGWPGVRPIRGILESPALAPSGKVITKAGYNDETGYVLLPSVDVGKIENPTQKDAREALKYLWSNVFCDFPYLGLGESDPKDVDRLKRFEQACKCPDAFVGIAALLSMAARPAIRGATPGSVFEAASQGSGKTLQIHAISTLATGRSAGLMTFPTHDGKVDEAELEKILASYALAGARLIAFDNIKGTLGGAALEKAMTAVDSIDFRVLGSIDQRTMPWSATMLFSGNNMAMSDDAAQRVLCSRLESEREDPRSRPSKEFRHPRLLDWIQEHRSVLVRACLVILRAFIVAEEKSKRDAGSWGSFEAWSALIPSAILYAGGPNILELRQRASAIDNGEGAAHSALMRLWPTTQFPNGVKLGALIKYAFPENWKEIEAGKESPDFLDDLRNALREISQTPDGRVPGTNALGSRLRELKGKWKDGCKFQGQQDTHSGVVKWWVERREQVR